MKEKQHFLRKFAKNFCSALLGEWVHTYCIVRGALVVGDFARGRESFFGKDRLCTALFLQPPNVVIDTILAHIENFVNGLDEKSEEAGVIFGCHSRRTAFADCY